MSEKKSSELWVNALIQAEQQAQARPLLSEHLKLNKLSAAYEIQAAYVKWKLEQGQKIAGYKAALTAEVAQKMFSVNGPGAGVLFTSGQYANGVTLRLQDFNKAALEVEIGYRVKKAIRQAVNPDTVLQYIGEILPMLEVADLGYANPNAENAAFTAIDLIAGNSASAGFILGADTGFSGDCNNIKVSLSQADADNNYQQLLSGTGVDALGDQLQALSWLINHTLEQSYQIETGHLLMTGTLGRVHIAQKGNFVADYGPLGQIKFRFED